MVVWSLRLLLDLHLKVGGRSALFEVQQHQNHQAQPVPVQHVQHIAKQTLNCVEVVEARKLCWESSTPKPVEDVPETADPDPQPALEHHNVADKHRGHILHRCENPREVNWNV